MTREEKEEGIELDISLWDNVSTRDSVQKPFDPVLYNIYQKLFLLN